MTVTVSNKPSIHSDGKACGEVFDDLVVLSFHDSVVKVVVESCNSSGNTPRKYCVVFNVDKDNGSRVII